jgi:hypothetical protein
MVSEVNGAESQNVYWTSVQVQKWTELKVKTSTEQVYKFTYDKQFMPVPISVR